MSGTVWPKVRDALMAFGAVYAALTLAGHAMTYLPALEVLRILAMAIYILLLGLYAAGTPPGRRAGWLTYAICGLLCPLAVVALAFAGFAIPLSYEAFSVLEILLAGFGVGVRITGSTDPDLGARTLRTTFLLWWSGLFCATLVVAALRGAARRSGARRRSVRQGDQ